MPDVCKICHFVFMINNVHNKSSKAGTSRDVDSTPDKVMEICQT